MRDTGQQTSIEYLRFARLIKDIKAFEKSLGGLVKIIFSEEKVIMSKLRK